MSHSVAYTGILQLSRNHSGRNSPWGGGGGSRVYSNPKVYKILVLVSSHFQNKHVQLSSELES